MKAETLNSIDLKAVPDSAWTHLCAAAILESMQAKKAPPAATDGTRETVLTNQKGCDQYITERITAQEDSQVSSGRRLANTD